MITLYHYNSSQTIIMSSGDSGAGSLSGIKYGFLADAGAVTRRQVQSL